MNKNQFLIAGQIITFLLVATIALPFFGDVYHSMTNNPVATSTQTTSPPSVNINPAPPAHPLTDFFAINLPNSLMLVDSQGRRTGKDPATGIMYHEIPGTSYFEIGSSGQLYFYTPPNGRYTLYILGGATGQYYLDSWVYDGGPTPPRRVSTSGTIQKGSMIAYTQNYDTANFASSTPFFQSNISSTASITSAPPNNLPPPVVP